MIAPADTFVGRRDELESLRATLDQATANRGRIVMLAGEPGIGKTRTAQELADHAARHNSVVLWGRCHEDAGAPPYWPWVQIIRTVLRDHAADVLLNELGGGASDMAGIVPEIRDRLPGLDPPARLENAAEARWRMFETIRRFIAGLCKRQPVLILLDDLHWADAPSLRLLEFLATELTDSRLLLVGTYRQTELSRRHPLSDALGGLARAPHVTRIQLAGLSIEEVHDFITAATGAKRPAWLTSSLHSQTEGNPLFLREIVRFLEQKGVFGRDRATPLMALPPAIRIPEGVREVIGRRLNLLSASCNETLALAAVIGRDFTDDVLARAATRQDNQELTDALDEAMAAHIIEETTDGHYQFAHHLIRMTLYDELRPARRRQLHRAAGNAIEALRRSDIESVSQELAHHFRAAGDVERTIDYATRAGQRAADLLAFEDAAQSFEAALDAAEQRLEPDEACRCRLLFLLGDAQRKAGDSSTALQTLLGAITAANTIGDHELSARAALSYENLGWRGDIRADIHSGTSPAYLLERAMRQLPETETTLRAQVAGALARALRHAGAFEEARKQAARAIAMARQLGDPAALATSLSCMFDSTWAPDHTEELIGYATEMLAAAEQAGNMETVAIAYSWRLCLQLEFGNARAAEADLDSWTRIDARIRQAGYTIWMLSHHFMLTLMRGEFDQAEQRILELKKQLRRNLTNHEDPLGVMIFSLRREQGRLNEVRPMLSLFLQQHSIAAAWLPGLALILVELGRLEEARVEFERLAQDDFASIAPDGRWHFCMVYLSEVCAALGDAARAATLYRMLQPYTGRNLILGGGLACSGASDRHLGLLSATMSRWQDAIGHFEKALAMNQKIGAHVPLAHTRHDYATMLLARDAPGDRDRAMDLLRLSLESSRAMGMRALEERMAARLAQLAPQRPVPASDELTLREIEVLGLVAIGRSNADIAMVLEISLNTVATHVRNILAKTGCANRTEAAAYAMRNGLAAVVQ
jgi:DNA-binding CsgD family transcriptional regulator